MGGKGRTTTGMIIATLVKDILHGQSGDRTYTPLTVDRAEFPDEEEALEEEHRLGNYGVIEQIYRYIPEGMYPVDRGKIQLRAQVKETVLEADVQELHREILLPHSVHCLPQGESTQGSRYQLCPLAGHQG